MADVSTPTVSRFERDAKDIQLFSVLNILKTLGMLDTRQLIFENPSETYDPNREIIWFWGQDNDKKIRCGISVEALQDHYKGNGKNFLKIFKDNRSSIEHEARRKYLANRTESDNSILIKNSDL